MVNIVVSVSIIDLKNTRCGLFGGEIILGIYDVAVQGKKISNNGTAAKFDTCGDGYLKLDLVLKKVTIKK